MKRIWFNKTFSSVGAAIRLIREADAAGDYTIVCTHTSPHAPAFLAAHASAVEPGGLKGQAYLDWCLEFCLGQNIAIFVPGKEAALISAAHAQFEAQGTRVLCTASEEVLQLLNNKALFYQTVECRLAPPAAFRIVETLQEFDQAYRALRQDHAQLCIKPSVGVYGIGFSVLDESRSSAQLLLEGVQFHIGLEDLRLGFEAMGRFRTMLVMEYMSGHEYSVDCIGDRGRLICAIPRQKPLSAGQGQRIDMREDILQSTRELTASYGLNGFFNVQFREGQSGLRLLEINTRMSGGIAIACLAGPNLPYLGLAGFDRGYGTLQIPPIRTGLRVGEVSRAVELP